MPLTLHHLNKSQSERVLWLLEELGLDYTLTLHERNPVTALAPDTLTSVHPAGTAPVLFDDQPNPNNTKISLAESGACVEYLVATYDPKGNLVKRPGEQGYGEYLEWLHYANATLQPTLGRLMIMGRCGIDASNPTYQFVKAKLNKSLSRIENQLQKTGAYLAGKELTCADIMTFFTLTTMRGFAPFDLGPYPAILYYFQRIAKREGYQRAMKKGDKGLTPLLAPQVEKFDFGPHKQAEKGRDTSVLRMTDD